jgi:hypothetical protein
VPEIFVAEVEAVGLAAPDDSPFDEKDVREGKGGLGLGQARDQHHRKPKQACATKDFEP